MPNLTTRTDDYLRCTERRISGTLLSLIEGGNGRTILFLHSGEGPNAFADEYLRLLAQSYHVVAPWHPGFGASERPVHFRDIHDLAYFYLDFAEELDLKDAILAGASFGGWIALEMAIRKPAQFSGLALIGPLGIKVGTRETRDYTDMFAVTGPEWLATLFRDPKPWSRDFQSMSDDELLSLARSREALAYYGWQPYMHDPQLLHWLHRICLPTLIMRGEDDRVVREAVHHELCKRIAGSRLSIVRSAGHYPHVEQPLAVADAITEFAKVSAL